MKYTKKKMSLKKGMSPGTLIYTGHITEQYTSIELIQYNLETLKQIELKNSDDILPLIQNEKVNWINIYGLNDVALIEKVGKDFNLHNLLMEDILSVNALPKAEDFGSHIFFSLKMLKQNNHEIEVEHVSFVLFKDSLLSFQEVTGDVFNVVRERITQAKGRIRAKKSDYLLFILIDVVVDNYFLVLENINDKVQSLETQLLEETDTNIQHAVLQLKKQIIVLRKHINPLRESVRNLQRTDNKLVDSENFKYLNDVADHIHFIIETIDSYRENINSILELQHGMLNSRLNNIMKVLTIISSIFIPLSFIAGVYGMNFENMPELKWQNGYFLVLSVMFIVGILMLIFMVKRKWL